MIARLKKYWLMLKVNLKLVYNPELTPMSYTVLCLCFSVLGYIYASINQSDLSSGVMYGLLSGIALATFMLSAIAGIATLFDNIRG